MAESSLVIPANAGMIRLEGSVAPMAGYGTSAAHDFLHALSTFRKL